MKMKAKIFSIDSLKFGINGDGATTLVGMYKCPLRCEYCINNPIFRYSEYTIEALYNVLNRCDVYYELTGGGVCFGGHEPLLQQDFIIEFIKYIKSKNLKWKFFMETSLNHKIKPELFELIDCFYVDIKDMNPVIYKKYTLTNNSLVIKNLKRFAKRPEVKIVLRIPLIPGYNNSDDIESSKNALRHLGFKDEQFDILEYKTKND